MPTGAAYCYLLGVYLGTDTSRQSGDVWLQIVYDRRYPGIIDEISIAIAKTFPGPAPRAIRRRPGESDVLCISHPAVRRGVPSARTGRKHLRPIVLTDWQLELTRATRGVGPRTDPHGRLPSRQSRSGRRLPSGRDRRLLLRPLLLHQHVAVDIRRIFQRALRAARDPGDSVESPQPHRSRTGQASRYSSRSWDRRHRVREPSTHSAGGGIRTPTGLRPPAPKAGMYTVSSRPPDEDAILSRRRAHPGHDPPAAQRRGELEHAATPVCKVLAWLSSGL